MSLLQIFPKSLNTPGARYAASPSASQSSSSNDGTIITAVVVLGIVIALAVALICWYCSCSTTSSSQSPPPSFGEALSSGNGSGSGRRSIQPPGRLTEISVDDLNAVTNGQVTNHVVVAFVATWCGHCQSTKPVLEAAAKDFSVPIFTATEKPELRDALQQLNIRGFPTIMRFEPTSGGGPPKAITFSGPRTKEALVQFAS